MRWERLTLAGGDLSFEHPSAWRPSYYQRVSNVSVPLVYLSNEVLHDPCTEAGCGQPIDDLSPGGVLVS
jgi:hypothetical protein